MNKNWEKYDYTHSVYKLNQKYEEGYIKEPEFRKEVKIELLKTEKVDMPAQSFTRNGKEMGIFLELVVIILLLLLAFGEEYIGL